MKRLLVLSALFLLPAWSAPAHAQLFFKKARPAPSQRVPELILLLKTEGDERKRSQAAEELREYDTTTYTEIVPVLVDAATTDPRPAVRGEALASLAKIRPVSQAAGQALEKAAAGDENWRVRLQAKSALMKYHLAGYAAGKTETAAAAPGAKTPGRVTTQEPPLADPLPKSVEPPLATPVSTPSGPPPIITTPGSAAPRPLPQLVTPPAESEAPPLLTPQF